MNQSRSHDRNRSRRRSNNKVPAGWLDYTPLNTWIENTRIIPFKCPLRRSILRHVDEQERFSLDDLVERLEKQGRTIGLIIDLTDTDRYYDYRDVEDMNIEYCKIRVPGHQNVPEKCCQQFFRVVNSFLHDNQHNDKLIGIHCTHGINRSGYFIVRYLIEILGLQPNDAIAAFNRARGHQIEKYIDDLQTRIPVNIAYSSLSDQEEHNYYLEKDRPLPYTRPTTDTTSNDFLSETSELIV
ncbi:unnamed protein product [Adineta steineri]|uniref:Uncharacterized protein n=1 Tax=Adineta steineri TaxID=433720 RepID=A0A818Q158_9BILA|nr:unnamed protein product [Adineta steineri]CAF1155081.1 unnamed protein product [Adineta steineri]CAF1366723.1 unnamed protein product [Adineta steineri]CAF1380278.1 unnamed protein product [Adineta steineri]CAF3627630.1 unnamed protein product [Adineta steineri]